MISGFQNLNEYRAGFRQIYPDGIAIYSSPYPADAKITLVFHPNEGTEYKSTLGIDLEFNATGKAYVFYVSVPYHVDWVQDRTPPNGLGVETWGFEDKPFGGRGSLINATFKPYKTNVPVRLSGYFGFDEPISVQDRGRYTTIIPIFQPSEWVAPAGFWSLERTPINIDVMIPWESLPSGNSYPYPDKIILTERKGYYTAKHMIWHFDFSTTEEPGQTVLASYFLPNVVESYDEKLFRAALGLAVGIPLSLTTAVEIVRVGKEKERHEFGWKRILRRRLEDMEGE